MLIFKVKNINSHVNFISVSNYISHVRKYKTGILNIQGLIDLHFLFHDKLIHISMRCVCIMAFPY